ncbi:DNA modification system-associated small protein [Cohnella sp. GCM10012308]|uniref:DNA modification system-associated small protein n=1 Tax=Cohnella sp. GCM10012308 TaxID=3317329 RepID=UPI0036118B86
MTISVQEEDSLLVEICMKNGINPQYLRELFIIEKEYADKNMARRRGIYDRITELIESWIEEEEAGINAL